MDSQLTTIQPGGGVIIHLEQFWGRFRRVYLRIFRRGYIKRMAALRQGDRNPCPHPVLDPRDLKFHQNQPGGYYWKVEDDPFRWRDNLPFARVGLAELFVFSFLFFVAAIGLGWLTVSLGWSGWVANLAWFAVLLLSLTGIEISGFFRNPNRVIPDVEGAVVSPADGKVVAIEELDHDEFVGGPAIQIGIFLSIFNVHINRTPIAARVIGLKYKEGKYLNALRPESAKENEQLAVRIEGTEAPYRKMVVRQITGAIARRIVCWLKPGDELDRGDQFGMIKLGSRTELVMPKEEGLKILTKIGDHVQAGSSILAEYETARD
ncbi:MAG: phosphatidylserine decarboxylase family protein [Planctomycetaceae bacterium]|nr:phosphatidylserine decarboxylase family protein [Planctomycetaceae bacterium]